MTLTNRVRRFLSRLDHRIPSLRIRLAAVRAVAFVSAVLTALAGASGMNAQGNTSSEYQVKAAFLFHFAQFVDWPPETFKDATSPLTFCTLGEGPFHGALTASLSGKTIGTRPLRVLHLKTSQESQGCQVLFLTASDKKMIPVALAGVKGQPVLTVGETEHFVLDGGMIGFLVEENKIRFAINRQAAESSKLKISSKLLSLAKSVVGAPEGK